MPATKTVLSFGLVAIPISLHRATQDIDVGFHQLHKEDEGRIRYKKMCENCGHEVKSDQIVKGYEYEKGQHVVVTDAEIEKIKTEKEKSIQILHFVDFAQICSIFYDRASYALPEPGGEKAYELLRRALLEEGKAAIGKTVLGTKETLLAILPREDGLVVQTLYFADEIRETPRAYQPPKGVAAPELDMARQLVRTMDAPFSLADYHDEYQGKLKELLAQKVAGQSIAAPQKSGAVGIADLMDALKQSVEQAGGKPKAKANPSPCTDARKKAQAAARERVSKKA
jgi:DNA end-binding protein Ku